MKKGLLTYMPWKHGAINIGDYIQSLAAKQFLGDIDQFVCRENLNTYAGEKIKLIMNGWFTHEPQNWPPGNDIEPFFVSFHLNSTARKELLIPENIQYLKKHEPIGCRDITTAELLKEHGIDSYFSGCLTLTLGDTYKSEEKTDEILFVDPYFEVEKDVTNMFKYFRILLSNFKAIRKITNSYYKKNDLKSMLKMSAFFDSYKAIFDIETLENGVYIQNLAYESDFSSEEDKFSYADYLLNRFARAKLIVTNRIHCALPSISMETPVIFVENLNQSESSYCRLEGIRELFNVINYNKGILTADFPISGQKINKNSIIKNKGNYLKLKERLAESCRNFVKSEKQIFS